MTKEDEYTADCGLCLLPVWRISAHAEVAEAGEFTI